MISLWQSLELVLICLIEWLSTQEEMVSSVPCQKVADALNGIQSSTDGKKLGLKPSDKVIDELEDVGQQLALIFNNDGSVLALGGEDGKLRVFKWPSMEIILDVSNAHASVKDLDFSPDGKFLVSIGSGGPGWVWDVTSLKAVASLSKEHDEVFGFCRFSHSEKNPVLYITAMRGQGGSIVKWDTSWWKRVSTNHVVRDPVCAFNASADGMLLAV